mgnify:CR=1 FL=1
MNIQSLAPSIIQWGALTLVFLFGLGVLYVLVAYIVDKTQTTHTIRRNYPVVGRFRYVLEHLGEFFRQYFFAMDREELPFNRAERSWVYRASKKVDSTIAFGSTRSLNSEGEIIFINSAFPILKEDTAGPATVVIGKGSAAQPYETNAIINISAMSFGSISKPAVRALSMGAKAAGIWLNTGEGGLSPYHLEGGCDVVFQIGTAKYGVRDNEGNLDTKKLKAVAQNPQVKMFEIKLSQGAKPGKGGILPGAKVTEEIANIRNIPVGKDSISPNGHTNIRSTDDVIDMVCEVRELTGRPVGIKLVVGDIAFIEELCLTVHRRGVITAPDFITIDSADGGTGAAPQPLMDYVGMPIRESLPQVVDMLIRYGLRERIKVVVSGKLITPSRVAWALAVGADFINSARGFMFSLGCIQAMQCNKNTCPTGITTHKKSLQRGLVPEVKSERVAHYARQIVADVNMLAHSCGVPNARDLNRSHLRVIEGNRKTSAYTDYYPDNETPTRYQPKP